MGKYRLINEDGDSKINIEFDDRILFTDLLDRFKDFTLACGYHPDIVNNHLGEDTPDHQFSSIEDLAIAIKNDLSICEGIDLDKETLIKVIDALNIVDCLTNVGNLDG